MATKEQQIRNSFIYLLPVGVGNLIPLITLPIFTRVLTKEDYGIFALAQIYAIFVNGLVNFGLPIDIFLKRNEDSIRFLLGMQRLEDYSGVYANPEKPWLRYIFPPTGFHTSAFDEI